MNSISMNITVNAANIATIVSIKIFSDTAPPIYYILISIIFLIVFGAIAFATWLVWLTPISFMAKLVMTAIGFLLCAMTVILYTISAE